MSYAYKKRKKQLTREQRRSRTDAMDAVTSGLRKAREKFQKRYEQRMGRIQKKFGVKNPFAGKRRT